MTKILSKGEIEGFSCENCGAQKFYQDKSKNAFRCMYCDSEYFYKEESEEPVEKIKEEHPAPVVEAKEESSAEQSYAGYYDNPSERLSAIRDIIIGALMITFSLFIFPLLTKGVESPISGIFSIIKFIMVVLSAMFIIIGVYKTILSFYS